MVQRMMLCALLGFATLTVIAQAAPEKIPLDYHAFGAWRTIWPPQLSHDGRWLVYSLTASRDDGELVARNLDTERELREPRGVSAAISDDSRYVAYAIAPTVADVDAAERKHLKPDAMPKQGFGLLDLSTGSTQTLQRIAAFVFPAHASNVVVADGYSANGKAANDPESDTDLTLLSTRDGKSVALHHVSGYALSPDGNWLAYAVVTSASKGKSASYSLYARPIAGGNTMLLQQAKAPFARLTFAENTDTLAFLADHRAKPSDAPNYALYLWQGKGATISLVQPGDPGLPANWAPSAAAPLTFSKDGQFLYLGTAPVPTPTPSGAPDPTNVWLWSWQDAKLPSQQQVESQTPTTYAAEVRLGERRFVQLANEQVPVVTHNENPHWAVGISNVPYLMMSSWDARPYVDAYLVDLDTGSRVLVRQKTQSLSLSPGGNYILGWDETRAQWYTIHTSDRHLTWLTNGGATRLNLEDDDHPVPPPPYGVAGWTTNDGSVLLYDRYDIWQADPQSGTMRLVTDGYGRANAIDFRYVDTSPDARYDVPATIAAGTPLLLSAFNESTKASGFFNRSVTDTVSETQPLTAPKQLLMLDKMVTFREKAKSADRIIFTEERFEEFPNIWASGSSFESPQRVTDANPQQALYRWGTSRLIDFTNSRGEKLQAILTTPDGFDPHQKYPMIVYIYERMSDDLYRYIPPAAGTLINLTRYVSHGYVVLQPDIRYQLGHTTASAVDCVTSAVKRVIDMGFIDPRRIGVAGHSFGGYEVNALITHTDMFAAAEGGASDSDLTSLYGEFWGNGNVQEGYYETSQGRLGMPPWDSPETYIENSPLYFVQNVHTPYLRIQNDQDGAVPYAQGVEFFTALRRAGKEAYMFTFIGENHGLANPKNMRFWTVHMDEFFDHFLLGTPEPDWMKYGVPYAERGQRDVEPLFSPQRWPSPNN